MTQSSRGLSAADLTIDHQRCTCGVAKAVAPLHAYGAVGANKSHLHMSGLPGHCTHVGKVAVGRLWAVTEEDHRGIRMGSKTGKGQLGDGERVNLGGSSTISKILFSFLAWACPQSSLDLAGRGPRRPISCQTGYKL